MGGKSQQVPLNIALKYLRIHFVWSQQNPERPLPPSVHGKKKETDKFVPSSLHVSAEYFSHITRTRSTQQTFFTLCVNLLHCGSFRPSRSVYFTCIAVHRPLSDLQLPLSCVGWLHSMPAILILPPNSLLSLTVSLPLAPLTKLQSLARHITWPDKIC